MDPALATIIVAALGGTSVIGTIITGFFKLSSGKAQEEREQNNSLVARTLAAEKRARLAEKQVDWEAAARRITQELAARERRKLLEAGITLDPWPRLTDELGPRPE